MIRQARTRPRARQKLRPALVGVGVAALLLGACGTSDGDADQLTDATPTSTSTDAATDQTTGAADDEPTSTSSDPADTAATSSAATSSGTPTTLPGEPFEGFATAGEELSVVGVAHDDVLHVRQGPGTTYPVVADLDPTADGIVATGRARLLTRSIWYEVEVAAGTGWANSSFFAFAGDVTDVTAEVVASIGERPTAETMLDLGAIVAADRSSTDVDSRVVVSVAPSVGDLGEVTYDVIGLADDSIYGVRLHVFGQPLESGDGFSLGSVEQTALCGRGADPSGLCV